MRLLFITLATSLMFLLASCTCSQHEAGVTPVDTFRISVDELQAHPDKYINKLVEVTGYCYHVCHGAGRKAFLSTSGDSLKLIKCVALSQMNGQFDHNSKGHIITVTGLFREDRINEKAVREIQEDRSSQLMLLAREDALSDTSTITLGTSHDCYVDRLNQGQDSITSFTGQLADYRRRIAQRMRNEKKPYISFYHIEASNYRINP